MPSRRRFLAASGAALLGFSSTASATDEYPHADAKASDTTLEYDEEWLKRYRPLLRTDHLEIEPTALYGWKASHPGERYDVAVFFSFYQTQRGVTKADSHLFDREPFYVFVDDDREIESVAYAAYHWVKNQDRNPPVIEDDDGPHVTAVPQGPWNHYLLADSGYWMFSGNQEFVPLRDLHEVHSPHLENNPSTAWLDNGWGDALRVGAVVDPWIMRDAPDWWQADIGEYSFEGLFRQAYLAASNAPGVNIQGAADTDL